MQHGSLAYAGSCDRYWTTPLPVDFKHQQPELMLDQEGWLKQNKKSRCPLNQWW